ncbi:bifunctional diguanylate cyclase/phosphodiesterase [Solirubrobacter taibaiensis]|nr:bifunctional diguanylate cyclase/phosphodiesterase [Solirubrobacter taibaiensis]
MSILQIVVTTAVLLAAAVVCLRRGRRDGGAWIAFGVGIVLWTLGELTRAVFYPVSRPQPSVVDALYLGFYPAAAVGLVLMTRSRLRHLTRTLVLDGATALVTVAGLGVAFVIPAVIGSVDGQTRDAALVNLAYPLADTVLLAFLVTAIAVTGWQRLERIAGALALYAAADVAYVLLLPRYGQTIMWVGAFWVLGILLLASGARQTTRGSAPMRADWTMFLVPLIAAPVNLGVLLAPLPLAPSAFAAVGILLGMVRTGVTFRHTLTLLETRRQAITDELTGLANRRRFNRHLARAFETGEPVGLLAIDLDRFKALNDGLGHHVGDRLLIDFAERMVDALPEALLIARIGGDEFAVLTHGDRLAQASAQIDAALVRPFELDGLELHIRASMGGALAPEHASTPAELLQRADIAMYAAKRASGGFQLYRPGGAEPSRDQLALGEDLRRGIAAGELEVFYQPQADIRQRRIVGVEALVRWRHPTRGLLFPDAFLTLAEDLGLMRELTRHVLHTAVRQAAVWDVSVAVNLSLTDLLDPDLPTAVRAALDEAGLPAHRLVLEITENVAMADPERILAILGRLRALGCQLALDDFGTGLSSLARLRRLPVQELKIDRSFVMELDVAIVRLTIELGHALGIRVVAEGVETQEALELLEELGCDVAQGYHFSRPVAAAELGGLLAVGVADLALPSR